MLEPVTLTQDSVTLHGMMENSMFQGECRIEDGVRLLAQLMYEDGILHGMSLIRHPNGHVSARLPYIQGKVHGTAEFYTEDGRLLRSEQWRDGMRQGEARTLYPDGGTHEIAYWYQDHLHGERLRFHANGQLAVRQQFHRGQAISEPVCYADDGRVLNESGEPVSWWKHYWLKWTHYPIL